MEVTVKAKPEEFSVLTLPMQERKKKYPASLVAEAIFRSFFATFVQTIWKDGAEVEGK